jgi:uncharacterized membrane protein YbhN (UPF0104 family)
VTIFAFGILGEGLGLQLGLTTLIVLVPIALVASVVPLAIAGIGPREAALVGLLPMMNVASAEQALALSLAFALSHWLLAGLGGFVQLVLGERLMSVLNSNNGSK